jgi:hypothetical protein
VWLSVLFRGKISRKRMYVSCTTKLYSYIYWLHSWNKYRFYRSFIFTNDNFVIEDLLEFFNPWIWKPVELSKISGHGPFNMKMNNDKHWESIRSSVQWLWSCVLFKLTGFEKKFERSATQCRKIELTRIGIEISISCFPASILRIITFFFFKTSANLLKQTNEILYCGFSGKKSGS